jgi:glutathione S-transferase
MSRPRLIIGNKVYSSWSLRPWILMTALGLAFEETVIPLRQPNTRQRILAYSAAAKVPILIDGSVVVWESLAILEYLAEKHPSLAVWPSDPQVRAHARSIAAEMHAGFAAIRNACPMIVTKRIAAKDRGAEVAADIARITAIFQEARAMTLAQAGNSPGPFLYGKFSAADAMFAPVCTRLNTYSVHVDSVSRAYVDAVLTSPAYVSWLAAAIGEPWVIEAYEANETVIEDLRKPTPQTAIDRPIPLR